MFIEVIIVERLKELRKERNLTMKQLGEILGVAESTISLYESGKRQPDSQTLKAISAFFDVSVDFLIDNEIESTEILNARKIIKQLAENADLSISCIESALGVSYTTFRSWYNGYGDYFNSAFGLLKLAELFSVSVDYLLGRKDTYTQLSNITDTEEYVLSSFRKLDPEDQKYIVKTIDILADRYSLDAYIAAIGGNISVTGSEETPAPARKIIDETFDKEE